MVLAAHRRRAVLRVSQWAVVVSAVAVSSGVARAQTANISGADANVLILLSPFLTLNSTTFSESGGTAMGPTTLSTSLAQAININNNATTAQQQLSISDKNLLGGASNTVSGLTPKFGPAARCRLPVADGV